RRRHTRSKRDWSSDVCSSDLTKLKLVAGALGVPLGVLTQRDKAMQLEKARKRARTLRRWLAAVVLLTVLSIAAGSMAWKKQREEIGRASCRERVESTGGAGM